MILNVNKVQAISFSFQISHQLYVIHEIGFCSNSAHIIKAIKIIVVEVRWYD